MRAKEKKTRLVKNHNVWTSFHELEKMPTRFLLSLLEITRHFIGGYDPFYDGRGDFRITVDDVKEVLASREHIPSKSEGSTNRRKRTNSRKRKCKDH